MEVRIAGRVKSLRSSGAKLKFYDLSEGEDRIQAGDGFYAGFFCVHPHPHGRLMTLF